MTEQEVETKLGLSLDELIAQQKAKQSKKPAKRTPVAKGGKQLQKIKKVQTKGGGRVLVVPRPKHVPGRPGSGGLKATRSGGVHKGGPAPKYGVRPGGAGASRSVKVTIGNKLSGRPASHIPTSGVLSKPFGASIGGGARGSGPSHYEDRRPSGGGGGGHSLGARFDHLAGVPSNGPPRPTGAPRRNAHGVVLP